WVFKNKGNYVEKETTKQGKYEAVFNSPYDLHEYDLEKPEDMYPYHKYNGKSSKKRRRNGGLEEGKPSKEMRKAYGLGNIGTNNKKKNLY
ncbi:hypothetical protein MKX03_018108, partial [Papaver bracteatum]